MMTLAHYKGAVVSFKLAEKYAKNPEMKRRWKRAWIHAQRRVNQIERKVLIKK